MKNEQDIHHKFQEEQKAKKNSYRENVIEVNNNLNCINPGNDSKNLSLPKIALINLGKEIPDWVKQLVSVGLKVAKEWWEQGGADLCRKKCNELAPENIKWLCKLIPS